MCRKSLVVFILIFLCNLAYGQVNSNSTGNTSTANTLTIARKNAEIDENKYAHPDDFLYEEKVEDMKQEALQEDYSEEITVDQQQVLDQEAAEQQVSEQASSGSL